MMVHATRSRLSFRTLRAAVLLGVGGVSASFLHAASPAATVTAIQPSRVADLILLQGGFDAGLRQGMVCRVTRGGAEIAEILLVELRPTHASALILRVAAQQAIRAGDIASVKILKT
jgi:hypothetical protein